MQRSKLPYFFLGLAAVLAVAALVLLVLRPGVNPAPPTPSNTTQHAQPTPPPTTEPRADEPTTPAQPPTRHPAAGGGTTTDPAELVKQIANALEAGDLTNLERLLGNAAREPQTADLLKTLTTTKLRLRPGSGIREVGELELNNHTRWVLELDGREPGRDRIILDLRRDGQIWTVDKITLPPAPGQIPTTTYLTDSLGVADSFLQAVIKQNFETARTLVDPAAISDAKIAGLCIMFEEGSYRLRSSKPLRAMFQRQNTVGYLANVETADAGQSAQFTLTLNQSPTSTNWLVSEINLDQLLADYAKRVAGGDIYYSPLVKNPAGGDTLALYFEFNEDMMSPRTCRQLEIVARILRADPGKKLSLSGHTDALGTDPYNHSLSLRRANAVRDFLVNAGVTNSQIVTIAKGSSQPRQPNITATGSDNPQGRRANRRTEIYLDF